MKIDKQPWLAFIDQQQQSNMSIATFCRDKNINRKYFYYHRSQHYSALIPLLLFRLNLLRLRLLKVMESCDALPWCLTATLNRRGADGVAGIIDEGANMKPFVDVWIFVKLLMALVRSLNRRWRYRSMIPLCLFFAIAAMTSLKGVLKVGVMIKTLCEN